MVKPQNWLASKYESTKSNTTEIKFDKSTELEKGKLEIIGYPKLKSIFLVHAKGIDELIIDDCPDVEVINVPENQITKIDGLEKLTKLKRLFIGSNQVKEIDLSNNVEVTTINLRENPESLEIKGIDKLTKLVSWDSYKTFPLTKILDQKSEEELREIAEKLGLDVKDKKTPDEIKSAILAKVGENKQDKEELKKAFPDLFKDDKIVEDELNKLKDNNKKGDEYKQLVKGLDNNAVVLNDNKDGIDQSKLTDALKELGELHDVVNHPNNARILTNGRFEQSKLDGELSKSDEYEKLVKDNSPDLVNSDGDKIDQTKIDGLKTAGGDAANAITTLGVGDLKDDTLKAKLGNKKLSDIPDSKNLESLLKTNEDLEKLLKGVGIDPTNFAETAKQIKKWKGLEESVKDYFGKDRYEEQLDVERYQTYIEVNTNKQ